MAAIGPQGHNEQCSESFYKEHIDQELQVTSTDNAGREKTVQMLKRAAEDRVDVTQSKVEEVLGIVS